MPSVLLKEKSFPDIINLNFLEFATEYVIKKGKLETRSPNVVPRIFPTYSSNPKGENYGLYCKYQLLKYKPWKDSPNDIWGTVNPDDSTLILKWQEFLKTEYAQQHIPDWKVKLQQAFQNVQQPLTEEDDPQIIENY